jgi:FtsZ-interacting cell division protein ZipA
MATWLWILIVVAAVVAVAIVAYAAWRQSRTKSLRSTFGPEYERATADTPRREAEAELLERQRRHDELDIRPLSEAARDRYLGQWEDVQARFVDDPEGAVGDADRVIQQVMADRGYPVDDFEQRAADVSVEHPDVVENYRQGHTIATSKGFGDTRTEELRQAMRHYRSLFEVLLVAERQPEEARR